VVVIPHENGDVWDGLVLGLPTITQFLGGSPQDLSSHWEKYSNSSWGEPPTVNFSGSWFM
jgi:hypothetical protein